jgi:hypothetical protein
LLHPAKLIPALAGVLVGVVAGTLIGVNLQPDPALAAPDLPPLPTATSSAATTSAPEAGARRTTASVDLRQDAGRGMLLSGFWPVEDKALGHLPGVWSSAATSRVTVPLTPTGGDYELRIRAEAFRALAPIEVRARINDKPVGAQQLTELDDYRYRVPAGVVIDGDNIVALEYSKMGRPSEHGEEDSRQLSIRLFELDLEPAGS